jgi:hypothetical protein
MEKWSDPALTEQVVDFYRALDDASADDFDAAVEKLAETGPTLGRPTVGEVDLRDYPAAIRSLFALKELRVGTIRVLFTFGPDRVPVLLFAGDKQGDWSRWYPKAIKAAARSYEEYLRGADLDR